MPLAAKSRAMRSLMGGLGLATALLIGLVMPIGYAANEYREQAEVLSFKAQINAERVAKYVDGRETHLQYHAARLADLIQMPVNLAEPVRQRIRDNEGNLILDTGEAIGGPLLRRDVPIVVSRVAIGRLEAEMSLAPFLETMGFAALASLALGFAAYFTFRVLPLRVLDSTLNELKTQNARFVAAVNNMPIGLVMFDTDKRLVVGNDRYREMYGLPQSVTKPGTHLREMLEHRLEAANFEGQDPTHYIEKMLKFVERKEANVRVVQLSDGRTVNIIHHPTDDGWIGTHEDITERARLHSEIARQNELLMEHERQLEAQNVQLDAALENISQGLSMFDCEHRLVLCNERYLEMYGLSSKEARPGTDIRQLLELRIARGTCPRDVSPAAYIAALDQALKTKSAGARVVELCDGRFIAVANRSMPNGGWVATHADVTELKRREDLLAAQNFRFDAALNNMSQGLCMFDAQQRLVVCNERYARIYGLPDELVRPGTTVQAIIAHRISHGMYAGDDPDSHALRLHSIVGNNQPTISVFDMADGRSIVIKHQPMAGGGWVATHEDITEQRRAEAQIAHMAHHDALTDLANRVLLHDRLKQALADAAEGGSVAVLCLDLDRFKEVNDTLGHPTGDVLLKAVAARLLGCVRDTDTVARIGGDEFAVVHALAKQPQGVTALAERIIEAVTAPYEINGHQIVVGTSVGISVAPNDTSEPGDLIKNADLALYRVKGEGRGTYRFFEPAMDALMHARRKLESDLRRALVDGHLELHYQPILDVESDKITTFEALLRWNHPERGMVPPAEFIPIAEEIGLIGAIGEWVLRAACAEASTWPDNIKVAVNLSPLQFNHGDIVLLVSQSLIAAALAADRLELEITESVLLENTQKTLSILHRLKNMGVHISMDDFGTGYSSLSNLRSFPFDKIKIDKSFVQALGQDNHSLAIVEAVIGLSARLDMATTAEGVETEDQLNWLRAMGITEAQGYHIARPMPASNVTRLLLERRAASEAAA